MKPTGGRNRAVWGGTGLLGILALLILAGARAEQKVASGAGVADGVSPSAAVPGDWLSRVQQDIAEREYHLTWQEGTCIEGLGPAWQAPNRAQNLRTYFTEGGPRVVRRTEVEPTWVWGLELVGIANDECRMPNSRSRATLPEVREVVTNGNRIEFHREGGLMEWYVNDPRGLEEGFTVQQSAVSSQQSEIVLDLAVRGNLTPGMMSDGETVEFLTEGGVGVIHYGELRAWDAEGKDLVARMELLECGGLPPLSKAQASLRNPKILRLVVDASGVVYPVTIDPLATSANWTAESNQDDAEFSCSVATAGDINGDGYSDIIIGARYYDNGQSNEGRAFVYHGSPFGLSTSPAWFAESDQSGARLGWSVATAGDVNGDGYSDVIIGARDYDNGQSNEGRAFVYHGSASGLSSSPGWIAESDQAYAMFGVSVSTAGDVNGDGYSDVIVGAFQYANGQPEEGRAYVYHGSASGLSTLPDWTAEGDQGYAMFGVSVSTAGDVNGDGYSDIIVGAHWYTNGQMGEGRAFVYHGSALGLPEVADWTAESNQRDAFFGVSVATAGDVNGDGYSDVIVGAYQYTNPHIDEGRAFVYHGSASGLSPSANWTAESDQTDAEFGHSVATAGDVNGDGYSDVIIGALWYEDGQRSEGRAFVYHGSVSGLSASANWKAESDQEWAHFGYSVSTAGDVNGDGYSDVIVGACYYDNGETDEGRAYVYHGSASGLSLTANWTAESDQDTAGLGYCASMAGDVNGDGYSDVIVGAPYYDNGEENEGRAFVYQGSGFGLSVTATWSAESDQASAYFGRSVSTAGDVNGDGYSDVIVGAHYYDNGEKNEGRAFVYHGSLSGLSATADWSAEGDQDYAYFGRSVSTVGDVNGDGYSDVIVAADFYDNGQVNEGGAFVYQGSASGLSAVPAWTGEGDQEYAYFGYSVSAAGDVNGDGYCDIIVGAPYSDDGETDEGGAFVWHGSASGLGANGTPANADWSTESDQDFAYFGCSVSTAGDVNGDGYSDVIVGAHGYDNGQNNEGGAFVYHGSGSGLSTTAHWSAESDQEDAWFGDSVSTAGDVNGDGYSDVIVGAFQYDNGEEDEGRAFVYHGSGSGLSPSAAWTAESDQVDACFGCSVSTAGDVNGDGYSDVIVGAYYYDNGETEEGRAYVYYGNGEAGGGVAMQPGQFRTDLSGLVSPLGFSDVPGQIQIGLRGRNPFGRGKLKMEVECKPLGALFDGTGTTIADTWSDPGVTNRPMVQLITGLSPDTVYHWRVRLLYHPATTPYQQYSRWFTPAWNGAEEGDFRTAPAPAVNSLVVY